MKYASTVLDLIGNTPLVKLNRVTDGIKATVLVKLEYLNPGGSIKDRIALKMVERAEESGQLKPGGTIVEPTSGNTGVGLAMVGQLKGYNTIFVTPDKVGEEKRDVLRAYGAKVVVTPTAVAPDSPESYYGVSDRLVTEIDGAYKPDQFSNPGAPDSHFETTGPEIWNDTDGKLTHAVISAGTGGTITGTGRYLKQISADRASGPVKIIAADPDGSVYSGGTGRPYFVEGVGEDMWPGNYDPSVPDAVEPVTDAEAFEMTRRLAKEEGLLLGGSSGMAVVAALRAAKDLGEDDVVVVIAPDGGRGYLAKIFNDQWMLDQGFTTDEYSALDFIGEALAKQGTATVPLDTTLAEAAKALREQGDDALVVATAPLPARIGEIRGVIGASDITDALLAGAEPTSTLADLGDLAMPFIGTADTPEHAQDLLKSHPAVLLTKGGEVIAAATAADLLAYTTR
ncbi:MULTISPECIES: pyridoxal-phosphate dependent enzyme [Glutamicibacter]|uniref:Cystathionine beta-synthase n=1 Tax=Glutamicibacter nicotianae TaxID=37929 RepID=A0ABQ0RJ20_GLUNI|nr:MULTISPECIES: pyridoxal-phosphate dependent enzyme [Glutamicibacter]KWR70791.1 cystathionine beta-synthase [Arthrobacter sp. W1]QEP07863.1 pyridoxal-phosphate dependent enzyme [Glutamicibacter sp. ZJUTW]RWZ82578.1 pyridoxal-phosphate dependent enzyme [Glutamicibacter sp. HZAU]WIV43065.1 pyridoxal-phosphate dependent enzyme [Glutamicibacter nicotianae]GEC11818.1 putative cystathionine beta-synthase [Glutamicibacter nicotianae]